MHSIALFVLSTLFVAVSSQATTGTPQRCTKMMRENGECGSPRYHGARQLQIVPTVLVGDVLPTGAPVEVKTIFRTKTIIRTMTRTLTVTALPTAAAMPTADSLIPQSRLNAFSAGAASAAGYVSSLLAAPLPTTLPTLPAAIDTLIPRSRLPRESLSAGAASAAVFVSSLLAMPLPTVLPTAPTAIDFGMTSVRPMSTPVAVAPAVCATKIMAGGACTFESASCCSTGTVCVGSKCTAFCTLSSTFSFCNAFVPCASSLGYVCTNNTCQPPAGSITVANGETCDQGSGNTRFCIGGRGLCVAGTCVACTQVA